MVAQLGITPPKLVEQICPPNAVGRTRVLPDQAQKIEPSFRAAWCMVR